METAVLVLAAPARRLRGRWSLARRDPEALEARLFYGGATGRAAGFGTGLYDRGTGRWHALRFFGPDGFEPDWRAALAAALQDFERRAVRHRVALRAGVSIAPPDRAWAREVIARARSEANRVRLRGTRSR